MTDLEDAPTITEDVRRQAQSAYHGAEDSELWATHVLICQQCESYNVVAYGGEQAKIVDEGLPVSETCHNCEQHTRQYDVDGLRRRQ